LAFSLEQSFLQFNNDFDFFIIVADYDVDEDLSLKANVLNSRKILSITDETYEQMAFKYNVTEFCTSIKPFSFEYFFSKEYELVSYFDPDVIFYSKFNELSISDISIFLTPHILTMEDEYSGDIPENSIMLSGTYNCGFIAIRNDINGKRIVSWWKNRLRNEAFMNSSNGIYTDQKWIEYIPSFIELKYIYIIRNLGCNFSYWNYFERKIVNIEKIYWITSRLDSSIKYPLCFSHFSGYNYLKLIKGIIENKYLSMDKYDEITPLLNEYAEKLKNNNHSFYGNLKYTFNNYTSGFPILDLHRKLYTKFLKNNKIYDAPFSTGKKSFYQFLKKHLMLKNNIFINMIYNIGKYIYKKRHRTS
jgi:hypothetical protein